MPYAKRDVLPGYPKEFVFETRGQIDAYLGGQRVTCLLCGHEYRILETHLRGVHSMTGDDYRELYGLPYHRGLCGSSFSERRVEQGKELWEENTERQAAALAKAKATQASTGTNPQRGKPLYWRGEMSGDGNPHRRARKNYPEAYSGRRRLTPTQ